MGALLLVIVIVNAFLTGRLMVELKSMKKVVSNLARVQHDYSLDIPDRYVRESSDEFAEV